MDTYKYLVTFNVEVVDNSPESFRSDRDFIAVCDSIETAKQVIEDNIKRNNDSYTKDNESGFSNIAQSMNYNLTDMGTYVRYRNDKDGKEWLHEYDILHVKYIA